MLLPKVVPVIKEKWPAGDRGQTITIQQDNAGPHIDDNNKEFCLAIEDIKSAIKLGRQPAQSFKTNVLDLGLFCAIDCAQKKRGWRRRFQRLLTQFHGIQSTKPFLP